ncbi:putative reverse transcriptase domain-containing protein [Tanacetum coccineum]
MDWLAYYRALIDCYEKIVCIPLPNGEILEVQGERPEKDLGSLALQKKAQSHLKTIPDLLKTEKFTPQFSKVESVKNWKTPESPTEIRSFLGLAGYYRRFIENFSKIAKPLTLLTQKNKAYVWAITRGTFPNSEGKLCQCSCVPLPDGPDDFVVYCDASNQGFLQKSEYAPKAVIELLSDYECGSNTTPSKANVIFEAKSKAFQDIKAPLMAKRMWPGMKRDITELRIAMSYHALRYKSLNTKIPQDFFSNQKFLMELGKKKLAKIYVNEIVARHVVAVSIISDRDGRFTSHLWQALQEALVRRQDRGTAYHSSEPTFTVSILSTTLEDMLRACVMILVAVGITHLPLIEFPYNKHQLIGPEIVQETTEKIFQIKERLKTARSRQKSYADKRRKPLEFEVGDRVLLKVSPWKSVCWTGAYSAEVTPGAKLCPRQVSCVKLKKCLAEPDVQVPLDEIEIDENLRFVEEPLEIVEQDVKKLKRRRIPLVKVRWNSRQGAEYTWEREDQFRIKYPHLFSEPVLSSNVATFEALRTRAHFNG